MKTIAELKAKMEAAQNQIDAILEELNNENVEIVNVEVDKIEVTTKDSNGRIFWFRSRIETKIRV